MTITREEASEHGLVFVDNVSRSPADPDQEIVLADITIDGHTEHLQGKSEEGVLEQAERLLASRGRIQLGDNVAEGHKLDSQSFDIKEDVSTDDSDVHDDRDADDNPHRNIATGGDPV